MGQSIKGYILVEGVHLTGGVTYRVGNIIPLTDSQAVRLGSRVKLQESRGVQSVEVESNNVEVGSESAVDSGTIGVETITPSELLSKSAADIGVELDKVTNLEVIDSICAEEIAGKQRVGVIKALKARKKELEKGVV